jgi:hypothetical protein
MEQSTKVSDVTIKVTKFEDKVSPAGKKYIKATGLHEKDDGTNVWLNLMAFKGVRTGLLNAGFNKGSLAKITGQLKEKEYQKADGTVGVDKTVFLDSVKLITDDGLVKIDNFYEPPQVAF